MTSAKTNDTSQDAEEVLLQLIRNMPPEECGLKTIQMTTRLIRECKDAIRKQHPDFTDQEVGLAFIELNYGAELAKEVRQFLAERQSV
ncbi:MAG: hypothetical protein ABL888_20470 [Pirellulaceae bacterium]